jgi:imidazolonepropionase
MAVKNGQIVGIEKDDSSYDADIVVSANHKVVLPGFIDGHTHLVHGGSREHEFKQKLEGVSYMDILKQGGGILSTVAATRKATFDDLYHQAYQSLNRMLEFGVTTIESKSGYGLDALTEIKQLEVNRRLNHSHPIDIHTTYLKAHALPTEYKGRKDVFVDSVIVDLKIIKDKQLATSVDVFCETGVFDKEDTYKICKAAMDYGLKCRIHTDEMDDIGGTDTALNLTATSIDHLISMSDKNIKRAAKTQTLCNLLPSTSFYLDKPYARARKMVDEGCLVGISSDYNPGSTPSENLQFSMHLAALKMKLTPKEVLVSTTYHPAIGLGIEDKVGSLEVGKLADFTICDVPNLDYFIYHYGINHVTDVFKKGECVVKNRRVIEE